MYSADIVRRARLELAQRKENNQSQYRQRLQQAYESVPRLRQIDLQLRQTMTQAAQTVFTQGGDAVAAMEQVKRENLALQQERRELELTHFGPGWLEETPVCAQCGGSGYIGSGMCRCLHSLCAAQQKKELSRLCTGQERFENFRLELYPDRVDRELGVSPVRSWSVPLHVVGSMPNPFSRGRLTCCSTVEQAWVRPSCPAVSPTW